jgi:hypothetical protein
MNIVLYFSDFPFGRRLQVPGIVWTLVLRIRKDEIYISINYITF